MLSQDLRQNNILGYKAEKTAYQNIVAKVIKKKPGFENVANSGMTF